MSGQRVVVVGGGLAGITAALDCADAGASVTLLEVRRRLGGAAYSVQRDGLEMDNGQHVFLRGCLAYRGLLARLGSEGLVHVQPRLRIPVLKPGAAPFTLKRSVVPAPLHLAGAIARYPHIPIRARAGTTRAALAMLRERRGEAELDADTLGAWLAAHGQSPRAVEALWDLIALPTLNLPAAKASLALGMFVFRTGLLSSADAGDIGFHVGTLAQILSRPAETALARARVDVRLGWRAEGIARAGAELRVLTRSGRGGDGDEDGEAERDGGGQDALAADAVVVALPHTRAAALLEGLLGDRAARWRGLGSSPIVNLHVVYDREVCEEPFAAGVDSPVQYLFDRSTAAGAPPGCQYLAVSLSGADREMTESVEALRDRYLPALAQLLPRARHARVESFLVTREHAATFRAAPGTGALRPRAESGVPGLLLAGTWTATGWPATLESAVLSGHEAAAGALRAVGLQAPGAPPGAGGVGVTGATDATDATGVVGATGATGATGAAPPAAGDPGSPGAGVRRVGVA
jgi:squalene-associated FAD-dependent desaturase